MGWVDLILGIIVVLMIGALWRSQPRHRRHSRYEVVVTKPDNPRHLIERRN